MKYAMHLGSTTLTVETAPNLLTVEVLFLVARYPLFLCSGHLDATKSELQLDAAAIFLRGTCP